MSSQPPPPGAPGPQSGPPTGWTPPPGYGAPPPGYAAPPPGYAAPPPGYGAPPPYPPPPAYPPGYPQAYPQAWAGPPAVRPGIVALRPLRLGDLYDGAFKAIRQNPKTMVGLAALVTTAFMLVPTLLSVLLAAGGDLVVAPQLTDPAAEEAASAMQGAGLTIAQLGGVVFAVPATVLVTGVCVHVVHQAVLGRRTGIGEAWAAARGRLLRLLGLTVLSAVLGLLPLALPIGLGVLLGLAVDVWLGVAVGVVGGLLGLLAFFVIQVRLFYLAPAALMLERTGIGGALGRSWSLSRAQFWRLFGIWLLTGLIVGLVGQVVSVPTTILGMSVAFVAPESSWAGLVLVLSSYVSTVIVGAVTTPFVAAVSALLYVDQRIRKEAYDVELIAASQQRAA